jgi:hypothetical protein
VTLLEKTREEKGKGGDDKTMRTPASFIKLRKMTAVFLVWVMLGGLCLLGNPLPASAAKTNASLPATCGLQVNVVTSDAPNTVSQVANYSLNQIQGWPQHEVRYSSIDSMPAPVATLASGVYLSEVLQRAGFVNQADDASIMANIDRIRLYATDSWANEYTADGLWGKTAYYYPDLVAKWDRDTYSKTNNGMGIPGAGSEANGVAVEPILALSSFQDRFLDVVSESGLAAARAQVDQMTTFRFCFGQKPSDIAGDGVVTTSAFGKWVYRMDVFLKPGVSAPPAVNSLLSSPLLSASYTEDGVVPSVAGQSTPVKITFAGDVLGQAWRSKITGIDVDGTPLAANQYVINAGSGSTPGTITMDPAVFSRAGTYSVAVHATGYTDDCAVQLVSGPLAAPQATLSGTTLSWGSVANAAGYLVTATPASGTAVTRNVAGTSLDLTTLSLSAGDYGLTVVAKAAAGAVFTDSPPSGVVNYTAQAQLPSALAALSLSGNPALVYNGEPLYYVLTGLNLSGTDQYGAPYSLAGQNVLWNIDTDPLKTTAAASISGSTLTINSTGTVAVRASIGSVTSNLLSLTVSAPQGVPAGRIPDEILLSWTGNPQTTQTITWRAKKATSPDQALQDEVQYLPWAQGNYTGGFTGTGVSTATAAVSDLYGGESSHFEAILEGLAPATRYAYRVGCADAWSDVSYFTTAGTGDAFSFLYMGDVQDGFDTWGNLLQEIYAQNPDLRFGLLGGDLVDSTNSTAEWQQLISNASPVFSRIPLLPTAGNHDEPQPGNLAAYPLYWQYFALPQNGPDGYKEQFYSFDYGNSHIAVLDSNVMGSMTATSPDYGKISAWLQSDLTGSSKKWKFLVFHHPAYPVVEDAYSARIQQYWAPLFEQCGVDIAFVGHQHVYMRSKPLFNGQVQADPLHGTVYIMGDAGSKFYPPGTEAEFQSYIERQIPYKSNYEVIRIEGDQLTLVAKDSQGQEIDSFTIDKTPSAERPTYYTLTPVADDSCLTSTANGICTLTVKSGVSGLKYFGVAVQPLQEHEGTESIVFVQLRNGVPLRVNVSENDFDVVPEAQAGFNVESGDVVKAYIVDELNDDLNDNPVVLH